MARNFSRACWWRSPRAESRVELELYLVEAGECADAMVQALVQAAERGVRVRCLFDDYGSLAFTLGLRRRLIEAGVELRFYNRLRWRRGMRNLYRDHRKLLLVDSDALPICDNRFAWHEVMVLIQGPLVLDWQLLFDRQWLANEQRAAWRPTAHFGLPRLPKLPAAGQGLGRVAYADARQHRDILQSLVRALNSGKQRIWLLSPPAPGRGTDLRIPAVLSALEDGAGRRLGQHRFVQFRPLEPALQPGGQSRGAGSLPDRSGRGQFYG